MSEPAIQQREPAVQRARATWQAGCFLLSRPTVGEKLVGVCDGMWNLQASTPTSKQATQYGSECLLHGCLPAWLPGWLSAWLARCLAAKQTWLPPRLDSLPEALRQVSRSALWPT